MNSNNIIGIITVCYNSASTIEITINSVLHQSDYIDEYLIIDGGSTDDTVAIIKRYEDLFLAADVKFSWVSEPDNGIYDAMNKGIKLSISNWLLVIGSDDWLEPNAISTMRRLITECRNDFSIVHGLIRVHDNNQIDRIQGYHANSLPYRMIEHPSALINRCVYNRLGLYDVKLKSAADYDFMIRAKLAGVSFIFVEKIIANFSLGGVSSSGRGLIESLLVMRKYRIISYFSFITRMLKAKLVGFLR